MLLVAGLFVAFFPTDVEFLSDVFLEGVYFLLVVALAIRIRQLEAPRFEFGWMIFVHARWIDCLDELFNEPNPLLNPYLGGLLTALGLGSRLLECQVWFRNAETG
jgi:hypothetical protein